MTKDRPGANQPSFLFSILGTSFNFRVLSFEAVEAISAPFQVNISVGCDDVVSFEEVAGKGASLTVVTDDVTANGGKRYFHGNIAKFKSVGDNGDCYLYRARLVPAIWRLSLEQDCRVFQDTTLQAIIGTGPPGEQIYHDKFGRVKVQFHWDRKGKKDDKSSCWLRCAQGWGGNGWGMQFIPRVGDEVLVAFLDGDPDRPVIVGSLYNSENMPLYDPQERKGVSSIKTRSYPNGGHDSFHELRFDDQNGREEIYLKSERDWNILVKNDKGQTVGNDETLIVNNNRAKTVGTDQSETIGSNKSIQVGMNHTESIGSNMSLTVGANKSETVTINSMENVGLAKELSVGGAYAVTVIGGMNTAVGLGQLEEVGLSKEVFIGKSLKMQAGDSVEITCGKSSIKMDSAGNVTIKGTNFDFAGSEHIKLTSEMIDLN